jgi:hypothetical protein
MTPTIPWILGRLGILLLVNDATSISEIAV